MSRTVDQPHFVWLTNMTGKPERQKWASFTFGPDSQYMKERVIASFPISEADFERLTLDDLTRMYPCPDYGVAS